MQVFTWIAVGLGVLILTIWGVLALLARSDVRTLAEAKLVPGRGPGDLNGGAAGVAEAWGESGAGLIFVGVYRSEAWVGGDAAWFLSEDGLTLGVLPVGWLWWTWHLLSRHPDGRCWVTGPGVRDWDSYDLFLPADAADAGSGASTVDAHAARVQGDAWFHGVQPRAWDPEPLPADVLVVDRAHAEARAAAGRARWVRRNHPAGLPDRCCSTVYAPVEAFWRGLVQGVREELR